MSNRDGNDEIYTMNTDGMNVARVTNNAASDRAPTWQPLGPSVGGLSRMANVGAAPGSSTAYWWLAAVLAAGSLGTLSLTRRRRLGHGGARPD